MENKIAGHVGSFLGYHSRIAYRGFQQAGLKYVELPATPSLPYVVPELMDDEDIERLKEELRSFGLSTISMDGRVDLAKRKNVDRFKTRLQFASRLGIKVVLTDATREELDERGKRVLYNTITYLGDFAADLGVYIALDVHGGMTRNGSECLKIMKALNHDHVRINYDTGNIYYYNQGIDPAEDVKQIAPYIVGVHLKDSGGGYREWNFPALGDGKVKFPEIFKTLNAAGFYGPFTLELEGTAGQDLNRDGCQRVLVRSLDYLAKIGAWKKG
jgi:inosose dehydratase